MVTTRQNKAVWGRVYLPTWFSRSKTADRKYRPGCRVPGELRHAANMFAIAKVRHDLGGRPREYRIVLGSIRAEESKLVEKKK